MENNRENITNLKKDEDEIEDVTMYGEAVASMFSWMTPDQQRKRVREIEERRHVKEEEQKRKNRVH